MSSSSEVGRRIRSASELAQFTICIRHDDVRTSSARVFQTYASAELDRENPKVRLNSRSENPKVNVRPWSSSETPKIRLWSSSETPKVRLWSSSETPKAGQGLSSTTAAEIKLVYAQGPSPRSESKV